MKQSTNVKVRVTWDDYQNKFGCCGVRDYKDYCNDSGLQHSYSIPMSCCNHTALDSAGIECSAIVRNITETDVSSYYIYENGCSATIISRLKLNSTTVHDVGILAITGSAYILISILAIFILTVIVIPEDNEQRFWFIAAVLVVLFVILNHPGYLN
jgi:hypothetical protein